MRTRALLAAIVLFGCRERPAAPDAGLVAERVSEHLDAGRGVPHDEFVARRVSISDLEGILHPTGLTTAALGRRTVSQVRALGSGLELRTRCAENFCVDGVFRGEEQLLSPRLNLLEQPSTQDGAWLERVVRVSWQDERFLSLYVAQSEFSGGAHANNQLRCLTLDKKTGRALRLQDVLTSGELLQQKANKLFEAEVGIEVLGFPLDTFAHGVTEDGFRLAPWRDSWQVVLCAEGSYPSDSASILELRAEAIPPSYLLR